MREIEGSEISTTATVAIADKALINMTLVKTIEEKIQIATDAQANISHMFLGGPPLIKAPRRTSPIKNPGLFSTTPAPIPPDTTAVIPVSKLKVVIAAELALLEKLKAFSTNQKQTNIVLNVNVLLTLSKRRNAITTELANIIENLPIDSDIASLIFPTIQMTPFEIETMPEINSIEKQYETYLNGRFSFFEEMLDTNNENPQP